MVEFALIAPLIIFLLFVVIEAGLYVNARATVDNAAREGARAAAMCGGTIAYPFTYKGTKSTDCGAAVSNAVTSNMGFLLAGNPGSQPVVRECTPPPPSGQCPSGGTYSPVQGAYIQVSVDYPYYFYLSSLLGGTFQADVGSDAVVVSQQ